MKQPKEPRLPAIVTAGLVWVAVLIAILQSPLVDFLPFADTTVAGLPVLVAVMAAGAAATLGLAAAFFPNPYRTMGWVAAAGTAWALYPYARVQVTFFPAPAELFQQGTLPWSLWLVTLAAPLILSAAAFWSATEAAVSRYKEKGLTAGACATVRKTLLGAAAGRLLFAGLVAGLGGWFIVAGEVQLPTLELGLLFGAVAAAALLLAAILLAAGAPEKREEEGDKPDA